MIDRFIAPDSREAIAYAEIKCVRSAFLSSPPISDNSPFTVRPSNGPHSTLTQPLMNASSRIVRPMPQYNGISTPAQTSLYFRETELI
jgi:hypothetical protein